MTPAGPRRGALAFIFVTVVLDMLALGMIAPVLPKLVVSFVGGDAARASLVFGVFGTAFALMQFAFSPLLGMLSDRWGRKPVIVLSNLGLGLDYVVMALAPNLAWLFAGRIVAGVTSASMTVAGAYIADVTPPDERAAGFGMIGAAFGLGFILGPAVGGLLANADPRLPFWVAAGFSLLNGLYGAFVLPESLAREHRTRAFAWGKANPLGSLRLLRSHRELFGLAVVSFTSMLAGVVLPSVFVLYVIYRYGWDQRAVGLSLALVGLSSAVVQGGLVGPAVRRLGERSALLWGLAFGSLGMALYGLGSNGWVFSLGTPVMALWGLAAAAQQIMTRRVGPSEQGELQGAIGSLRGIAALIGPAIFTLAFTAAISPLRAWNVPGAPWYLAALLLALAMLPAWWVTRPEPAAAAATVISA